MTANQPADDSKQATEENVQKQHAESDILKINKEEKSSHRRQSTVNGK